MKKITLFIVLLFAMVNMNAQITNYSFTHSVGTYNQNSASATALSAVRVDSYMSPPQPIGFNFDFDGVTYSQFLMSSNGFISLNTLGNSSLTTNDLATVPSTSRPIIAPLWDDLDGSGSATSVASYEVTGSAPNRVLTVEWRNWEWIYSANAAVISFQIKLYESTNIIDFVYRQEAGAITGASASIGICSATGSGAGTFLSVQSVTAPSISSTISANTINTKPTTGQLFRFSPPPACTGTPIGGSVAPLSQNLVNGQVPSILTVSGETSGVLALAYQWEQSTDGTNWVNAVGGTGATTLAYTPPAFAGTTIQYRLKITCTTSGLSAYSSPGTLSSCPVSSVPVLEIFTSQIPTCWQEADNGDSIMGPASFGTSSWTEDGFANSSVTGANKIRIDALGDKDWILSPIYNIPTVGYDLKFDAAATQADLTVAPTVAWESDDYIEVLVSDGTSNWTVLYTYNNSNVPSNSGTPNTIDLDAYAGQNVRFAFRGVEGASNGAADIDFFIDNFQIKFTPANDNCVNAIMLTPGGVFSDNVNDGTNLGATNSSETAPVTCGGYAGGDVWYSVVVPASGSLTIETGNSTGGATGLDTVITIYSGVCGALTQINCDNDGAATGAYSLKALTGLTPGTTLFIRVYENGNDATGGFGISAYDASLSTGSFDSTSFKAYPNPVKNVLNLSYSSEISSVEVYNMLGQNVMTKTLNLAQGQIDLSSLNAGNYIVKVNANGLEKAIKIVKK